MKIGDRCFVHGHIDEIRKDIVIIKNSGGYFGTVPSEVITVYDTVHPNWIPCSERLPEKEVVYIITVHHDDRNFIAFDNFCSYKHGWKEWSNQEVLAWMPLPEPYREEK